MKDEKRGNAAQSHRKAKEEGKMLNAEVPDKAAQRLLKATAEQKQKVESRKQNKGNRAGSSLFPGGELLDYGFGDGGDDLALVGVVHGECHQNELRAVGKLNAGGVMAAFAHPTVLGPELRAGRNNCQVDFLSS